MKTHSNIEKKYMLKYSMKNHSPLQKRYKFFKIGVKNCYPFLTRDEVFFFHDIVYRLLYPKTFKYV